MVNGQGNGAEFTSIQNQPYNLTAEITSSQGNADAYHVHWTNTKTKHADFYVNGSNVGDTYEGGNSVDIKVSSTGSAVGVTAEVYGGATHNACDNTSHESIKFNVTGTTAPAETTISLDKTEATLNVGDQTILNATVSPSGKAVTWASGDEAIATVDQSGTVTAVEVGETAVTATTDDGKTATCKVVVKDSEGAPEQDDEGFYLIETTEDLQWAADQVNKNENTDIDIKLMKDIDASDVTLPIGDRDTPYSGTFDGNGKTVTVNIDSSERFYIGLIGYAAGATIENVIVKGTVNASYSYPNGVGGILGGSANGNHATIIGCVNEAAITASGEQIGGIAGRAGTLIDCVNKGEVKGSSSVGGIAGFCIAADNCLNTGQVTASARNAGGIAGVMNDDYMGVIKETKVVNSINKGDVTGTDYVGGLVGCYVSSDTTVVINNSYNTGNITTTSLNDGGIGGLLGGSGNNTDVNMSLSYNAGTVTNVGENNDSTRIRALIGDTTSGYINISACYYVQDDGEGLRAVGETGNAAVSDESQAKTSDELAEMVDEDGFLISSQLGETTITLSWEETTLSVGDTDHVTATVKPGGTDVSWSSDKPEVATVDDDGNIAAVAAGTAVITAATEDGAEASCTVTVITSGAQDEVTLTVDDNGSGFNLITGETIDLSARVNSTEGLDYHVHWVKGSGNANANYYINGISTSDRNYYGNDVTLIGVSLGTTSYSVTVHAGKEHGDNCSSIAWASSDIVVNVSNSIQNEDSVVVSVNGGQTSFDLRTAQLLDLNATLSNIQDGQEYHIHWYKSGGVQWANYYYDGISDGGRYYYDNPVTLIGVGIGGSQYYVSAYGGASHEECDGKEYGYTRIRVNVTKGGYDYDFQGSGRSLKMTNPSDVTQVLPSEEEPDYPSYVNRINTPFYSTENAGFVLEMSGGKGQSTDESFAQYAMPHITVQDSGGEVVASYEDGTLDFRLNDGTITLLMNKTLEAGDYRLVLDKELCFLEMDYNNGRTLGSDITFEFTVADGERETTISLDRSELALDTGQEQQLVATVMPVDMAVTWSSDNEEVARVLPDGTVQALSAGTATITATTEDGKTASCVVTVTGATIDVEGILLNKEKTELVTGATETLVATVMPENATDKLVTWKSSDNDVATVDSEGNVTGVAAGEATITASAGGYSRDCTVTVYEVITEAPAVPEETTDVAVGMTQEDADSARTVLSNIVNQIIGGGSVSGIDDEAKSEIIAAVEDENRTVTTEVKTEILEDGTDDITAYYINKVVKELSESINAEVKVQQYLDLGIDVLVDGSKVGSVTKLPDGEAMSFTIAVPKYIRDVASEYFIIRTHIDEKTGMESERIEHIDNGDGTLTFKTDRFSVYALAYTMGALDDEEGNGGNTGTGDDIITGDDNPSGGRDDSNAWNSGTVTYTAGQSGSPSNTVTRSFTGSQSGTQSAATGDEEAAAVLSNVSDLSGFDDADAAGGSQTDEADRNIVIPLLIAVIVAALLGITAVRAYRRHKQG